MTTSEESLLTKLSKAQKTTEHLQIVEVCLHKSWGLFVPCPVKDPAVANSVVQETAHPLEQFRVMLFRIIQRIQPGV